MKRPGLRSDKALCLRAVPLGPRVGTNTGFCAPETLVAALIAAGGRPGPGPAASMPQTRLTHSEPALLAAPRLVDTASPARRRINPLAVPIRRRHGLSEAWLGGGKSGVVLRRAVSRR